MRHASGEPGDRVDPEEGSASSEVAERLRGVARPGPVRRLAVAQLEAQAPVVGILEPEPGEHAAQAGERRAAGLLDKRRREDARVQQLAPERREVAACAHQPLGRTAVEARLRHPQRCEDPTADDLGKRHPRAIGHELAEHVEPGVRVDPRPLRRGHRPRLVRCEAGGVGEEVTDRRTRRTGRLVERDDTPVNAHEHGTGRDQLRDGGPGQGSVQWTARRHEAPGIDHRDGGRRGAPAFDRLEDRLVEHAVGPTPGGVSRRSKERPGC